MTDAAKRRLTDPIELESLAVRVAQFLHEKRARDIVVFRVRELLPIASFFVIASANSTRATSTLADGVERLLKPVELPRIGVHGRKEGRWICLDHAELIVHLFDRESRRFYDLENLWADAPRVHVEFGPAPAAENSTEDSTEKSTGDPIGDSTGA